MDFGKIARWLTLPTGAAAVALTLAQAVPDALILRFNPYALLSAAGLAAMAAIFAIVRNLKTRNAATITFSLFMIALIFWGTGEMFQRLSATPEGALFWNQVVLVGMALLPSTFYFFARNYTKQDNYIASPTAIYFIGSTALIFIYLILATDAIIGKDAAGLHATFWGFINHINPIGFAVFVAWLEIILISSILSLVKHRLQSTRPQERAQTGWFIAAMVIPVTGGTLTEGILPLLDYHALPMTLILTTISAVIVVTAMKRFNLFILNPATVAENILATMKEAVVVLDNQYRIEYLNEATEQIAGYPKDELIGASIARLFPDAINLVTQDIFGQFRNQRFARLSKARLTQRGGSVIPVAISAAKIKNDQGAADGYIMVLSDITELEESYQQLQEKVFEAKEISDELKKEKSTVEQKVIERTRQLAENKDQLEKQNIKLKKLDEAKTIFLSVASHQLRTPLTIAQLALSVLADPRSGALAAKQQKTVSALKTSIDRMSGLINDLLNISRMEQGRISYDPKTFSLLEFVNDLVAELAPRVAQKSLRTVVDVPPNIAVTADPHLMKEILGNLIDNAIKYNKPGGIIKIHASERSDSAEIIVHDTGIGISKDDLAQVGQQFYRSKNAVAADPNGTGLGLFIVENLVKLHRGKMTINSNQGLGTTVAILIPRDPPRKIDGGAGFWTNKVNIDI